MLAGRSRSVDLQMLLGGSKAAQGDGRGETGSFNLVVLTKERGY